MTKKESNRIDIRLRKLENNPGGGPSADISDLENQVDYLLESVEELHTDINDANSGLKTKVESLTKRMVDVEGEADELESNLSDLVKNVSALDENVSALNKIVTGSSDFNLIETFRYKKTITLKNQLNIIVANEYDSDFDSCTISLDEEKKDYCILYFIGDEPLGDLFKKEGLVVDGGKYTANTCIIVRQEGKKITIIP